MSTRTPTDEEDAYFKRQEMELRAKLRRKLNSAAGELAGQRPSSTEVAERIRALGFGGEKARVFDVLPLVHVAWADGTIQRKERVSIFRLLESRGIKPGSEPFRVIESLLESRPSEEFLKESLSLLKEVVSDRERAEEVVDWCVEVARSAGGLLGLGIGETVCAEERDLIEQIARTLGRDAVKEFRRRLG